MLFTLCAYCWAMTLNIYIDIGRLVAVSLSGGVPTPPPPSELQSHFTTKRPVVYKNKT